MFKCKIKLLMPHGNEKEVGNRINDMDMICDVHIHRPYGKRG